MPAKFDLSNKATSENFIAVLGARSKTVKIPGHIRVKMQSMRAIQAFWGSEVGQKAYATLIDEQKASMKNTPSKARAAGG